MTLTPGARVGSYEITAQIGVGGMGEVYRATDTNLKRQVAIKVLPASVAGDTERLGRFQREAEVLAALNHPHIAAIYGLEKAPEFTALVMELVEGEDLSQRIARGAIPVDEALPIGRQIAEALEAAHEQGIIHRDLKPANIKVRADGTVKVLDFGLAKAMEPAAGSSVSHSMSPTITTPAMTQAGMILGTAAYMSPEQARGKAVDKRADIWAFGAVLYEMLTGARACGGDDVAETLANVINKEPAWEALPAMVPAHVRQALRLCLKKDSKQRVGDIRDVRLALDGAFEAAAVRTASTTTSSAPRARVAWMVAAAAVVGMAALTVPAVRHLRETPPPLPPETRTEISTPGPDEPGSLALSPDGRQIVFVASDDGASRLWVRSLATTTAQPLAGTEGAVWPFWSPDGRSVGFFAGGALKRIDLGGGAPQTLAPVTVARGGTWNADGVIVFAPSATTPLQRVSATGGAVSTVTTLDPQQQIGQNMPFFLPDGRRLLFAAFGGPDVQGIYLGSLDGNTPTRLVPDVSQAVYLPAGPGDASRVGWLLWSRAGTLVAQRLDLDQQRLTHDLVTVADGVGNVSVAASGLVAYRAGAGSQRQLTWVDRSGTVQGTVGEPDASLRHPRVSPDGRRVVVDRVVQGNRDLWLLEGARASRLTFDAAVDDRGVWSPDGTLIVFRSSRESAGSIYQMLTNGAGGAERLVASDQNMAPTSWSRDGRFLLYLSNDPQTNADLWVMPMVGEPTPSVFLKTPFREAYGVFSPDGRWVAYHSNESGRSEIYVRRFIPPVGPNSVAGTPPAAAGGQWQVSTGGGVYAAWRPEGKDLYYLNPAGEMMTVPITVVDNTLEPGVPVVLFPTHIFGGGVDTQAGWQYDVAPDGRFLINTELPGDAAPITLIQHWNPDAKK